MSSVLNAELDNLSQPDTSRWSDLNRDILDGCHLPVSAVRDAVVQVASQHRPTMKYHPKPGNFFGKREPDDSAAAE